MDSDRIVVMDAGRVSEQGSPIKLISTEGSAFRALVQAAKEAED